MHYRVVIGEDGDGVLLRLQGKGKNVGTVTINYLPYKPGCEGKAGNRAAVIPGVRR